MRVGVIHNPRSHRNRTRAPQPASADVLHASPETPEALTAALGKMAEAGIDLLVIDGGDGTVRDVLSRTFEAFGRSPLLAVVPHGKTNVLARDLGVPARWTVEAAIASARDPERRATRPLIEVVRAGDDGPTLRGFVFGTGAYVGATRMATRAHRMGVIDSLAVGAALAAAIAGTAFGGARGWSAGEPMGLASDGGPVDVGNRFMVLASTLERFPLGLKPFGRRRAGLKLLDIDAPPRRLISALPPILAGREPAWLDRAGFRRKGVAKVSFEGAPAFVLDGEVYPGGDLTLRQGPAVTFVTA